MTPATIGMCAVRVGVTSEAAAFSSGQLLRPMFDRWLDSVEIGPPERSGGDPGRGQCHDRDGVEADSRLAEWIDDGLAERDDHLAQRDDDDQAVTLGEVAGSEHPVPIARSDRAPDENDDRTGPDDVPSGAGHEAADDDHQHRDDVGKCVAQR